MSMLLIDTITTIADQKANFYPIDQVETSFKFTLDPSITGYEWRIYIVNAADSLANAVEIAGQETAIF